MAHHPHHDQVYNTNHYVWSSRDRLGYGATGAVYLGYNKSNGERVAVKMFTGGVEFRALKREIDVVRSLPHQENIVKLFGVEEERTFQQQVIVMELCTGGSLYEVIDSPENAYGLGESEFKQVIYDVAKGLQHLRKHNFIHRDIKPGNIMRYQKPDGTYVFKLADFGTARELAPGETFFSLHGTEEYLYPGMYERALVNPQKKKDFSAKVDLWSVGATFFHAATGRLPFQPFRKRDDRQLMYHIISHKESGMISGWQLEPNGQVHYSRTLPEDVQLSQGLKQLITPILAGLMENELSKMSDFDDFFKCIEEINRKKVIDVFCVYSCTCHKIYIDPQETNSVEKLKQLIHQQTGLDPKFQELFFENLPYQPSESISASKLPNTTAERPFFVFGGEVKKTSELHSPMLPTLPSIPQGFAMANDVQFAKECSKVMWYFRFVTEQVDRMYRLMHLAALCFSHTVRHEYILLEQQFHSVKQLNEATCRVLSSQISGLKNLRDTLGMVNQAASGKIASDLHALDQDIRAKQESLSKLSGVSTTFNEKTCRFDRETGSLIDSWDPKCSAEIFYRCIETVQFLGRSVDGNYKTFHKERKHKTMSPHDQKVHEFTKTKLHAKLSEGQDKVVALLSGREQVYTRLGEWFLRMIPCRTDMEDLGKKLTSHSQECNNRLESLKQWDGSHNQKLQGVYQKMGEVLTGPLLHQKPPPPPPPSPPQPEIPREVLEKLEQSTNGLMRTVDEQGERIERLLRIPDRHETVPQHLLPREAR